MNRTEDIYNKRYTEGYREKLSGYEFARWSALEHFINKVVKVSQIQKFIDYGSGSGLHIDLWKNVFPKSELFFADISTVAIEKMITRYPEFKNHTCLINNNKTLFSDNAFDIVISIEVMEHVDDLDAYLKEIYRLLKPEGRFIWTTPCGNKFSIEHIYSHFNRLIEETGEGFRRWKWEDPTHLRRLKSDEIKSILMKIGYKKILFRFRAHFFSFVCTRLASKKIISENISNKLMKLDYKLFRNLPNGASMIGCAIK